MNWITILAIIGGGLVFIVILVIVLFRISNKKKSNNLSKTIDQYKKENLNLDNSLQNQSEYKEPEPEQYYNENKTEPVIEDYTDLDLFGVDDMNKSTPKEESNDEENIDWKDFAFFDDDEDDKKKKKKTKKHVEPQDEFEEFLDDYSYTRKIIDKDLLKKLNSLPPEVKEIILGNVFNKYDE